MRLRQFRDWRMEMGGWAGGWDIGRVNASVTVCVCVPACVYIYTTIFTFWPHFSLFATRFVFDPAAAKSKWKLILSYSWGPCLFGLVVVWKSVSVFRFRYANITCLQPIRWMDMVCQSIELAPGRFWKGGFLKHRQRAVCKYKNEKRSGKKEEGKK